MKLPVVRLKKVKIHIMNNILLTMWQKSVLEYSIKLHARVVIMTNSA